MSAISASESVIPQTEAYRVNVAGMPARVHLWNGDVVEANFYLRLSGAMGPGMEGLGERLNDTKTMFLACKVDQQVQLLHLNAIAYIYVPGLTDEVEHLESLGAQRQPARITLRTCETLHGEFLSILPPSRSRVSDLLNEPGRRFVLFLHQGGTCWVNRKAIARVWT
ncbi:MAG TPA: hypothetical protein VEW48_24185 [Thermoanaerobaculia bacterium]|nr:hypothetical protein [Thermoanaerobaculia bacterium]